MPIKREKQLLKKILQLSEKYQNMDSTGLKQQTLLLKNKLRKGAKLNSILPEAFATVREADRRVLGLYPYPVQLLGGISLHNGNIAEMKTGEGKTLTETMPVYLNALTGKGVHVVTVNSYLAERDSKTMGQVFSYLGLSTGYNSGELTSDEKQKIYQKDIVYSTNDELAFDYLRDNMVVFPGTQVQRELNFAIIDEVDSILIDEARTPLIISGAGENHQQLYISVDRFVKRLSKRDFSVDKETKTVSLTQTGVRKANHYFGLVDIYSEDGVVLAHYIDESLKANYAFKKDIDYVVKNGEVLLVDQFTGRIMNGRRFADGLHQAIEAKEGVHIHQVNQTEASITYQNYFRMYQKLAGMTGTASNEAKEFYSDYHMQVDKIPTNKPVIRHDYADLIYVDMNTKLRKLSNFVKRIHAKGQPILIGTTSVENSEKIHQRLLKLGLKHSVLNAKNNSLEAEIIKHAGEKGTITVATNMAGRGTDIKLGPGVKNLGGLFVIGTEKHESRRIDDQLRGRAGRQGDPGASIFFLSLDDELLRRYGPKRIKELQQNIISKGEGNKPITGKLIHKWIDEVQKRVEGSNYDERQNTLLFDDIMRREREAVYKQRRIILNENRNLRSLVINAFAKSIDNNISYLKHSKNRNDDIAKFLWEEFEVRINEQKLRKLKSRKLKKVLLEYAISGLDKKERLLGMPSQILEFERVILLKNLDKGWKENLNNMEQLRLSILLQGYGQHNPLVEYQRNAQNMYSQMAAAVEDHITRDVLLAEIKDGGSRNAG